MGQDVRSLDRDWDDAHLINAAIAIHHDDPEFGYRFITDELADAQVWLPGARESTGSARNTDAWQAHRAEPRSQIEEPTFAAADAAATGSTICQDDQQSSAASTQNCSPSRPVCRSTGERHAWPVTLSSPRPPT